MPPHDRCIVEYCNNDKRYPGRMIVQSNVKHGKLVFHKLPLNNERKKAWINAVSKGREDFELAPLQSAALQKVLQNIKIKIAIQLGKSARSSNSSRRQPFTDVLQNMQVFLKIPQYSQVHICLEDLFLRLKYSCFPKNIPKFLRTAFL